MKIFCIRSCSYSMPSLIDQCLWHYQLKRGNAGPTNCIDDYGPYHLIIAILNFSDL